MLHLKLFSSSAKDYMYSAFDCEIVSVLKTKIIILFTPILNFIFSILFFKNYLLCTKLIYSLSPLKRKSKSRFYTGSLFSKYLL